MKSPASKITDKFLRGLMLLSLMWFCCGIVAATTTEGYKAKVDSLRKAAVELESSLRDKEFSPADVKAFADQIRRDFPASERIESGGGAVETSNGWLVERAGSLETPSGQDQQLLTVVEIREYMSSVSFKLDELEQASRSQRTKDQDKQKLAEILRREEYQKPQPKQESVIQRWLDDFLAWLEDLFPKPNPSAQSSSGMGVLTVFLQVVLWAALLGLLAFLVYKIVPLLFPKLRRARRPKKKKERVILGERLSEDATAVDLFAEAERLAREGNLRGAIRKGYIALLCDLSDRKVIGLSRSKTNRDYLRDVRSRKDLHPRMTAVTSTFESHWYGSRKSADEDWAKFREEYNDAVQSV
jgi:hypothetical protein